MPACHHHGCGNGLGRVAIIDCVPPGVIGFGVIHPVLPPGNPVGGKDAIGLSQRNRLDRLRGKGSRFSRVHQSS